MFLRATGCSHVGMRRSTNEDRYALAPELGLFLVADGMGGHVAGQIASELATAAALDAVRSLQGTRATPADRLRHAVTCANRRLLAEVEVHPELAGMGTTLVMLMAAGDRATLAHVGDSRGYLIRDGRIRQLTHDHSLVSELVRRGRLTSAQAEMHPHRHVLTRAVGVHEGVTPDVCEIAPIPGDLFVMCSDGLTTHLDDAEIAEASRDASDLHASCQALVDLVNARGGQDNTTIVMLRYESEREEKPE